MTLGIENFYIFPALGFEPTTFGTTGQCANHQAIRLKLFGVSQPQKTELWLQQSIAALTNLIKLLRASFFSQAKVSLIS